MRVSHRDDRVDSTLGCPRFQTNFDTLYQKYSPAFKVNTLAVVLYLIEKISGQHDTQQHVRYLHVVLREGSEELFSRGAQLGLHEGADMRAGGRVEGVGGVAQRSADRDLCDAANLSKNKKIQKTRLSKRPPTALQ